MARDLTLLAKKLGMRYYEEENLLFGIVSGYECALREQPGKFIVFVDDLAFGDSCPEYTALKNAATDVTVLSIEDLILGE